MTTPPTNPPTRLSAEALAEMRRINAYYISRPDPPDHVRVDAALLAHISTLEAELQEAREQRDTARREVQRLRDERAGIKRIV